MTSIGMALKSQWATVQSELAHREWGRGDSHPRMGAVRLHHAMRGNKDHVPGDEFVIEAMMNHRHCLRKSPPSGVGRNQTRILTNEEM